MSQGQESEDEQMERVLKESLRSYEEERLLQETLERSKREEAEFARKRQRREEERRRLEEQRKREEEEVKRAEAEMQQRRLEEARLQARKLEEETRKALEEATARLEAEGKRLERNQQTIFSRLCLRGAPSGNENEIAIAASLETHEAERNRSHFNNRTNRILQSLDPPPVGRIRQCLELAKGTGGSVVGVHHKHANEIARKTGGNCSIRFLSRDISTRFDGSIGDCLLIEADDQESVEAAEVALVARAAEILALADRKPPATQPASPIQEKKEDTLAKKKIKQDQVSSPNTRPSHPAASSAPSK
jgi:hypothetical protein